MKSELLRSFFKTVNFDVDEWNANGIVFSSLLRSLSSNSTVSITAYVDLKNESINGDSLFEIGVFHIQMRRRIRNENNHHSHYELIIADNSYGNEKRMAVLTAESLESELVEMACSGMREDVIIDLNREGRRWEGGELNGKPFGFG